MDLGLAGKTVVLTGGSRGIGAATVKLLAEEGANVAFCARNQASIDSFLADLGQLSDRVRGYRCDVADRAGYSQWLAAVIAEMQTVDMFVGNATGGLLSGDEGWRASFDVDLLSAVHGAETLIQHMAPHQKGSIVLLGSVNATDSAGAPMAYSAMKAALINYANQLGATAGQYGIRVNTVSPGPIHVDDGFWGETQRGNPAGYAAVAARHSAGRLGTPIEVARVIAFLLSDSASWVQRSNIIVDGGYSQRIQF